MQVIIIKPRITVAFVRIYHIRYFFAKREIYNSFRRFVFFCRGDRCLRDLLTPMTFYR